jgi:putative acetyltransferase
MDIEIRLEQKDDYRAVEELTREAFWNLFVPGCSEHLLVNKLRDCPAFIPALDFVALKDNQIVGNIMYCHSTVKDDQGNAHDVLTFGPISVLPEYQKQGIGGALIRHSLKTATDMGYNAVLIYGDPMYYHRFGFRSAKQFNISTWEGKFMKALMALELHEGALTHISGRFFEGDAYQVNEEELAEFEKGFPYKEKFVTESQKRFIEMNSQYE